MTSSSIWSGAQPAAYAALHSPFCSGLAAGTLPREAFGAYIAQRRLLLAALRAALLKAEAQLPAATRDCHANSVAELVAGIEADSTRDAAVASQLGAADAGSTVPLAPTSEHRALLDAAADTGSLAVLFAAAAPSMRLQAWLGRRLCAVCRDGTPYREWLEAHASDEFEALAVAAEGLLDTFVAAAVGSGRASDASASGGVGEAADAYMTAMRIEVGLFAQVPGVPPLRAPPAALAADFDGTLTCQPDSTADLLRVAAEASADPGARADELTALVAAFGVKKAAHDVAVAALSPQQAMEARHAFEAEAYAPLAHALRGAPRHALAAAGASLPLRPGAMRALGLARATGVATHVVTLCPAADCVRGALRLGGCEDAAGASTPVADVDADVALHSSVLRYDGEGVCVGEFESVVASGADKLRALEKAGLVPARAGSTCPAGGGVAYVGDSVSDLPAMMAAGLAIALGGDEDGGGASASLRGAAEALGMSVQPLAAATVALATPEGLPQPGAALYAADGWDQISAVLLPPPSPGAGTGCGVPRVLIVAGSDSGGGAGIQVSCRTHATSARLTTTLTSRYGRATAHSVACRPTHIPHPASPAQADLKACEAHGVFGMTAVTALTAQNTVGVQGVEAPPVSFVATQMESVLSDIGADALKTGMIPSRELAKVVATAAARAGLVHSRSIVVDPVLVTSSGALLVPPAEVGPIARWLFPLAEVVTPNLPEAQVLLGMRDGEKIGDVPAMRAAARRLHAFGSRWVLLKGGHLESADESVDVLFGGGDLIFELRAPRVDTRNTHGTGCTLGSSVAALLARGHVAIRAAALAKRYVHGALCASAGLRLGAGHGALHHSHATHRWPPPPPITAAAAYAPKPAFDLGVYVITDAKLNAKHDRSLHQAVEAAIAGGATIIQLREKNLDSRSFMEAARECVAVHEFRIEHASRLPTSAIVALTAEHPLPSHPSSSVA